MASVEEELQSVKTEFVGRCRIEKDDTSDSHSITIQPKDMDVTLKFQLKSDYPSAIPIITVRSSSLQEEHREECLKYLNKTAETFKDQAMISKLLHEAEVWLTERNLGKGTKNKKPNSNVNKKKQKCKKKENDIIEQKQKSMKTSEDVIKRIQWDSDLPQEDFVVGYIDRFLGIQEKYFTAFSWEDISSVDYSVLAIPQHRIQYFKYKNAKVWDKNEKLDNVFGSLGSGVTIVDVIRNYDPDQYRNADLSFEHECDDAGEYEGEDLEDQDEGKSYLDHVKKRPTHFVALRVDDSETVHKLSEIQGHIQGQCEKISSGFMSSTCFHATLCTLGLDREEDVRKAVQLFKDMTEHLSKLKPVEPLNLTGIDNFYNRTVFAKIKYPRLLLDFVDYLKKSFVNAGIEIRDNYGFVPHITLLKISKQDARELGPKFQAADLYHSFKTYDIGTQFVSKLSLCEMGECRQDDGFWVSLQDIQFQ